MEVFVTIILPLNSLINPVVYSDLYTVIEQRVVTVAGKLVSMCWDGEPEEMKAGNDVEMVETKKGDEGRWNAVENDVNHFVKKKRHQAQLQ